MPSTVIYTLSLHDALPILPDLQLLLGGIIGQTLNVLPLALILLSQSGVALFQQVDLAALLPKAGHTGWTAQRENRITGHHQKRDRKSTRLNSSHVEISYAVHRDLHSFPTRRSSDLAGSPAPARRDYWSDAECAPACAHSPEPERRCAFPAGRSGGASPKGRAHRLDRAT